MRSILIALGVSVVAVITYILYQHSLGAIPFLLVSISLFYHVYRSWLEYRKKESIEQGEKCSKKVE